MEVWAQFIADCSEGRESNVVPFPHRFGLHT